MNNFYFRILSNFWGVTSRQEKRLVWLFCMSILNVKDAGMRMVSIRFVGADACRRPLQMFFKAISHNSKCRYGERGAAGAKPKAQIILDAAKVSAASGGCSEPKQGQRSQSAGGLLPPKHDAGTATRHYRAFWQRRCRAAAAGAVLKPQGENCTVLP